MVRREAITATADSTPDTAEAANDAAASDAPNAEQAA